MARFRFYHIPLHSWYSEALYQDVVTSWSGLNAVYLLLLLLACSTPVLLTDHHALRASVDAWLARARFIPMSETLSIWVLRGLFVALFLAAYGLLLCVTFCFSVAGLVVCSLLGTDLSLPALFRLSIVALTPAILVTTIVRGMTISVPFLPAILFGMTAGYVVFGIAANRGKRGGANQLPRAEW